MSRAIRLYAKILVAARIVADPTPVSLVLEQPDLSPDLLLVSWRIEHGLVKVVFAHDPARWLKFRRRCFGELDAHDEVRKLVPAKKFASCPYEHDQSEYIFYSF
jgi:hypothetical protein